MKMDWHDNSCTRLDLATFGGGTSCLSCGSFGPLLDTVRPPIDQSSEIRLLHILPGDFEDDLKCEMTVHALGSHEQYEAISYTWADESGDASTQDAISVSGKPFQVTCNCHMALRRARLKFSTRRVWVDAICIDQENVEERGHQVRLMPIIYSGAKMVLIYIGESTTGSKFVFESLLDPQTALRHDTSRLKWHTEWHALSRRRYFNRIWILQEIALARKALLICGEDSTAWSSLKWRQIGQFSYLPPVFYIDFNSYTSPGQFLNLLDLGRQCQASDPRDKIFALLGLLPGGRFETIEADYSLAAKQVYIQVALQLMSSFGCQAVLSRAGATNLSVLSLPSWVPDWTVSRVPVLLNSEGHVSQPISAFNYNEQDGSISLKLMRLSGANLEWYAWHHDIGALSSRYLVFRRLMFRTVYWSHLDVLDQDLYAAEDPAGLSPPWMLQLDHMPGSKFRLHMALDSSKSKSAWSCLPLATAVEIFSLSVKNMQMLVPLIRDELRVGQLVPITAATVTGTTQGEYATLAAELRIMADLQQPVEEEVEELWIRKWGNAKVQDIQGHIGQDPDVRGFEINPREFIDANDALWRLLVRCFLIKETVVEIV